mmetsp:Transcript_67369/g.152443  ORF Transcript_67369/g.152443 Transcript_67369/m.152443 type:complete len:220 (+) Transcript_67369:1210-1869(+)
MARTQQGGELEQRVLHQGVVVLPDLEAQPQRPQEGPRAGAHRMRQGHEARLDLPGGPPNRHGHQLAHAQTGLRPAAAALVPGHHPAELPALLLEGGGGGGGGGRFGRFGVLGRHRLGCLVLLGCLLAAAAGPQRVQLVGLGQHLQGRLEGGLGRGQGERAAAEGAQRVQDARAEVRRGPRAVPQQTKGLGRQAFRDQKFLLRMRPARCGEVEGEVSAAG